MECPLKTCVFLLSQRLHRPENTIEKARKRTAAQRQLPGMFFQTFLPGVLVLREWSQWGVCRDETELHQAERREPRLTKRHV